MKLASVLAFATAAVLAASSIENVSAASACTQSDAKEILSLTGEILVDKDCLADTTSYCPNAKCYATVEKVTKDMPNCVADGTNIKDTFQQLLKDCKSSKSTSTTGSTTTTTTTTDSAVATPSPTTKSAAAGVRSVAASAVVALSSIAAVVAFL